MSYRSLYNVLKNSIRVNIDGNSKIVFISDVHRGDGGFGDSLIGNKNIYMASLNYYYKEGYTLIEIGDGDELWKNKDFRDIAYNYKDVFAILSRFNVANRLHMIYGNHDSVKGKASFKECQKRKLKLFGNDYGKEFINLIDNCDFKEGIVLNYLPFNKEILVTHGHQVDFMNSELKSVSKFLIRYFWRFLAGVAGFKEPTSPANNYKKGTQIDYLLKSFADNNKKMLICGHTHRVKFPKVGDGLYFNDGSCVFPYGMTNIEINRGIIALVKWSIKVGEKNNLYIKREIIGGPERIVDYLEYVK